MNSTSAWMFSGRTLASARSRAAGSEPETARARSRAWNMEGLELELVRLELVQHAQDEAHDAPDDVDVQVEHGVRAGEQGRILRPRGRAPQPLLLARAPHQEHGASHRAVGGERLRQSQEPHRARAVVVRTRIDLAAVHADVV